MENSQWGLEIHVRNNPVHVHALNAKFNTISSCRKRTAMSTPEMEVKVEEATSNAEWGPSSSQLTEIASASYR